MSGAADAKQRFSSRVGAYVRYRPHYPDGLIPLLREHAGLSPDWTVADIGCGTGLSAEPFLRNGNTVLGVEPNDEMRAAAEDYLRQHAGFTSRAGSAEATGLPAGCADLIVCGHAFHWFDATAARAEFRRIGKPGTPIVVLWITRRTSGAPSNTAFEALLRRFGTDYAEIRHDRFDAAAMDAFFGGTCRHLAIDRTERLDLETLRGRMSSFSYIPASSEAAGTAALEALDSIYAEHEQAGAFRLDYTTEIHIGR